MSPDGMGDDITKTLLWLSFGLIGILVALVGFFLRHIFASQTAGNVEKEIRLRTLERNTDRLQDKYEHLAGWLHNKGFRRDGSGVTDFDEARK